RYTGPSSGARASPSRSSTPGGACSSTPSWTRTSFARTRRRRWSVSVSPCARRETRPNRAYARQKSNVKSRRFRIRSFRPFDLRLSTCGVRPIGRRGWTGRLAMIRINLLQEKKKAARAERGQMSVLYAAIGLAAAALAVFFFVHVPLQSKLDDIKAENDKRS